MKLQDLKNIIELRNELNFSDILRKAGLNRITISKRITRNSPELTAKEAQKIATSLKKRRRKIKKSLRILVSNLDKL